MVVNFNQFLSSKLIFVTILRLETLFMLYTYAAHARVRIHNYLENREKISLLHVSKRNMDTSKNWQITHKPTKFRDEVFTNSGGYKRSNRNRNVDIREESVIFNLNKG